MNPRTVSIVAVLALVVGAAGLIFGVTAKNDSGDAKDASDATQAQLERQLGEAQSANAAQTKAAQQAASGATKAAQESLADLSADVKKLDKEIANLQSNDQQQTSDINTLTQELTKLSARVDKLGG